jgi:hypothetical protein
VGDIPTSSPGAATGTVSKGSASLQVSGGVKAHVTFSTLSGVAFYSPPPGDMGLGFASTKDAADALSITGQSFLGTQPTSATLGMQIAVVVKGATTVFSSGNGECSVTIDTATATQLHGRFTCSNLRSTDGGTTANANGTFQATG